MLDAAAVQNAPEPQANHAAQELLEAAQQSLVTQNVYVLRSCNDVIEEGQWVRAAQFKARESTVQELSEDFNSDVLAVLKRNADQLHLLKQEHITNKESTKATAKKLMLWTSGQQVSGTEKELQADAVQHGRFRWFHLPGSSISSGALPSRGSSSSSSNKSTATAMKFWQTGLPAGASVPRPFSDTPCAGDQLQPQKSLTTLLFGKARRSSSSSGAAPAAASPRPGSSSRRPSDAASWRSSHDGNSVSRRDSNRSSDSGHTRTSVSLAPPQAVAAPLGQGMLANLAAGEGPLSKSHSLLAKPGTQQEVLMVGRSLEIVAEDEREGHDSPQPGAAPSSSAPHPALLATFNPAQQEEIVKLLAGPARTTSPAETTSFSFGNKQDGEPHSPNLLLRGSVSSRQVERRTPSDAAAVGPLRRSSLQLQASMGSRVDPFEAPEPQPQPFVEQMKLEDQAMKAGQAAQQAPTSSSIISTLRRSMGDALKRGGAGAAGGGSPGLLSGKRTHADTAPLLDPAAPGPLTASAGHMLLQPQQLQLQQAPTAGGDVAFLDLDATAQYASCVHDMLQEMQQNLQSEVTRTTSEDNSKPQSPTAAAAGQQRAQGHPSSAYAAPEDVASEAAAQAAAAMTAAATLARSVTPPRAPVDDEIVPAEDGAEQQQQQQVASKPGHHEQQPRQAQQQPERQHSQCQLQPPSPALSPQASGQMAPVPAPAEAASQHCEQQSATPSSAASRSLRPSNSSGAGSRRQSQGLAHVGSARRGLAMMGQASMDILGRPSTASTTSSKQLVSSSSLGLSLNDVYNQTSGNQAPLAAGLSSIRRVSSSSQSSRTLPPRSRVSPRALVAEGSMPSVLHTPSAGPLAKQYNSTMQHAKKSAQMAGLAAVSPREAAAGRKSPWGWQALGLPTGPGAPLADQTIDPATYPQGNKYAASWGLVDSATTAAVAATGSPGAGLSRQNSAVNGALSRQQSQAAVHGQMSRQNSAMAQRQSPRCAPDQPPGAQQWQQQQRRNSNAGAAGRYAHPASVTPTEDSPRSGRVTPRRVSENSAMQQAAAAAAGGRAVRTLESRRISDMGSEDSAYYDIENNSRTSSFSGISSQSNSARGGWQQQQQRSSNPRQQQPLGGSKGASPIPQPPAFLSNKPTSAQAAVAAQWSPNKHASAIAQAPAYAPRAYVSPEASGVNYGDGQGLQPHGLTDAPVHYGSSSNRGPVTPFQQQQQTAYAGGYSLFGNSAPADDIYASSKDLVAGERGQHRQQPHQRVVTAVDLARKSLTRRTSSSGGLSPSYGAHQQGAGSIGVSGNRGMGAAAGPPAGKAAYAQQQQQWPQASRRGMRVVGYSEDYE